jgi:hypothetical protein
MPDTKFRAYWNLTMIIFLFYTATVVPYMTAFINNTSTFMLVLETFVDSYFITDIVLQFFSAYEDKKLGLETNHNKIAMNYLKSWFFIDLFSR